MTGTATMMPSSPPKPAASMSMVAGGVSSASKPPTTRPSLKLKKGTKMTQTPNLPSPFPALNTFNSSFQMGEYLAFMIKKDPMDVKRIVGLPRGVGGKEGKEDEEEGDGEGEGASKKEVDLWIYEHLRRLPLDLTQLVTSLLPVCDRQSCPEMKAAEWVYLCVAHPAGSGFGGAGQGAGAGGASSEGCSAIDYILHTLDQHTALWNSSQAFPSRLSIKAGSERYFGQQTRRISRVFGHAWFHHREVFEECEAESALYARFLALVRKYHLMAEELLVIPWDKVDSEHEAEGSGGTKSAGKDEEEEDGGGNGQEEKKGGPGLKRSGTVMSASASGRSAGVHKRAQGVDGEKVDGDDVKDDNNHEDNRVDDGDQEYQRSATDPDPRGIVATAVRKPEAARDMTLSRRGGTGSRGGATGKSATRGRKRLFQVDIPKEDDEDDEEDELEHAPAGSRFSPLSKSPVNSRTGAFVGKQVTPTMRDLEASELGKKGSVGKNDGEGMVDPTAGDSSESDESDDSEGNSDPESAVNPGKTLVDSDDEGEEMVEDVEAVDKDKKDEDVEQGGSSGGGDGESSS